MRLYTAKLVYNFIHGRCLSRCHSASARYVLHPFLSHVEIDEKSLCRLIKLINSMLSQTGKWINACIKARFQVCVDVSARAL